MAGAAARSGRQSGSWGLRLFEAAPLPPAGVGLLLAAALLAAYVAIEFATDAPDIQNARRLRGVAILLVTLAYVPTAQTYLARWTRRNVRALCGPAGAAAQADPAALLDSTASRIAGGAGALFFAVFFLVLPTGPATFDYASYWTPTNAVPWLGVPILGWLIGRFAHAVIAQAHAVSRLAARLERVDLLDPTPLAPFVQQGLGSALLVMVMVAIGAAGLVGQQPVFASALANVTALLCVGAAALVLPVLGPRQRIRAEKRAQLLALRRRLDAARAEVLAGGAHAERAAGDLPGLLALEERLEAVREWPFDVSSLLRFGLYAVLGLGSWLGAALVERLLNRALD
jgi:hypothetical protein